MNYTTIEILGKQRGIKFNIYAIEVLRSKFKEGSDASILYAAVWGGLLGNMYVKGEEPDFTFEQLVDAIDDIVSVNPDALANVINCLNESKAWQETVKRGQEELDKKKQTENTVETI